MTTSEHDNITVKTPANRESSDRSLFISAWAKISCAIIIPLLLVLPVWKAVLLTITLGGCGAFIATRTAGKIVDGFHVLFGGGKPEYKQEELLESQLKVVKVAKMSKDYPVAIKKVNEVLAQDPYNPEAHFFKAQILHEGFGNKEGAIKHLKFALSHSRQEDTVHTWTKSLLDQIIGQRPPT